MQSPKEFLIDVLYKSDHGATIGELEKLISERDEEIRNDLRKSLRVVNYQPEKGKD